MDSVNGLKHGTTTQSSMAMCFIVLFSLWVSSFSAPCSAVEVTEEKVAHFKAEGEKKLRATFGNLTVRDFRASPIEGIYEIDTGANIIYFAAKEEVLIFGEMYSKSGESLTLSARQREDRARLEALDYSVLITQSAPTGVSTTEVLSLNCSFCVQQHKYLSEKTAFVNRHIVLSTEQGTIERSLAVHTLCTERPLKTLEKLWSGKRPAELLTCDKGKQLADKHKHYADTLGVTATPTTFINNKRHTGFKLDDMEAQLKRLIADARD